MPDSDFSIKKILSPDLVGKTRMYWYFYWENYSKFQQTLRNQNRLSWTKRRSNRKGHKSLHYPLRRENGRLVYECCYCFKMFGQLRNESRIMKKPIKHPHFV